jgi:SAM-dependent methyltransferase
MERQEQFKRPTGNLGKEVASYMNQHHEALYSWGLSHIDILPNYAILDVGCGGGKMVNRLANLAVRGKVVGIDYSKDMVEYSKSLNDKLIAEKHVEIFEESVDKMSFSDNTFDLVTSVETYYFWPNFPNALREIKRVLKPNGKLLLINELIKNGSFEIKNAQLIRDKGVKLFSLDEIKETMETIGFADIQIFKNRSPLNMIIKKDRQFWNAIIGAKRHQE